MNRYAAFDDRLARVWRYPGGEVGVRAHPEVAPPARLSARVRCSDDLLALVMYLAATPGAIEEVLLPYLPYARQDRVAAPGDPNAIAALARLLASTGVRRFATIDAHSPAAEEAFRAAGATLRNESPLPWLRRFVAEAGDGPLWIVAPDAGARARASAAARALSTARRPLGVVSCRKVRNAADGKLRGFAVDDAAPNDLGLRPTLVVVDDICDGGGTFRGVADALRARYGADLVLDLWTTHGIYSRGLDELLAHYRRLGCTDSFPHGREHARLSTYAVDAPEDAP